MPSLRQLVESHPALLLLDAASSRIQVGLMTRGEEPRWATSESEASRGLFLCLEELNVNPTDVSAHVFCEGPGSMLGIRTSAMAIRAWGVLAPKPVYRYRSLDLVAHTLGRPDLRVIADARRESWHCQQLGQRLKRVATGELSGVLVMPDGFRHWSTRPAGVDSTSYDLRELLATTQDADIFKTTDNPEAFHYADPSYRTWTPQIHRAP